MRFRITFQASVRRDPKSGILRAYSGQSAGFRGFLYARCWPDESYATARQIAHCSGCKRMEARSSKMLVKRHRILALFAVASLVSVSLLVGALLSSDEPADVLAQEPVSEQARPLPPTPPASFPPPITPADERSVVHRPEPGEHSGCRPENVQRFAEVPLTRSAKPRDVEVLEIQYLPAFGRAAIKMSVAEDTDSLCKVTEISSETGISTNIGYPQFPVFSVPGRYEIRVAVGDANGRSAFSEPLILDLKRPSDDDCKIDPSFGENTVCSLSVSANSAK